MIPVDLLSNLPLFEGLSPDQVALLKPLFVTCDFFADTIIFKQGEPAENLYIVLTGEVVVSYKPEDGPALIVTRVQPGGVVGWSAALRSRNYTSAAYTAMYSRLLRVRGVDLRLVCEQDPILGQLLLDRLASLITERLHSTHSQVLALLQLGLASHTQYASYGNWNDRENNGRETYDEKSPKPQEVKS
jgi:CRP/FNR family cyclic AMP-dependent transcriptional regulator